MGRGVWDDLARNQAGSCQPVLTAGHLMPMLGFEFMRHDTCFIFFRLFPWVTVLAASSLHAQESAEACLREYPALYTLETGSTPAETATQRVMRTHGLLATKLKMTPEAVAKILPPLAKRLHTDKSAPKFDRACASFVAGFFAEAQTLALEAGDTAHRADPRQPGAVISALRLAAFSAMEQGQQEAALKFISVALGETSSDRDLPTWTQLQTANARAFAGLKMLKDEEQTLRYIYTEHERILGARHADSVRHHSTLAGTLYQHGHDAEAERETRAVLKSTLLLHGPKHEQTQVVQKNLARVLEVLGRHAEAESLRREVLAAQMEMYGGGAASTLRSREQLVKNLSEQKKHAEAEIESRTLTEHSERVNGADAVTTLSGRSSLALAIHEQGRHEESVKMLRPLEADCIRVLGPDHVDTLRVRHALGTCLNALKQHTEAESVLTQVLEARKQVLPADDITTLDTRHQLSIAYLGQEKIGEAIAELRLALTGYENALGKDHARYKAANMTSNELVKLKAGREFLISERRGNVAKTAQKLGAEHQQTILERVNMADLMLDLGERDAALKEYQNALDSCRRLLGDDHLGTLELLQKVATMKLEMNRFAEAESLLRQLLDHMARQPNVAPLKRHEARYHLGICVGNLGRIKEAKELVKSSYEAIITNPEANPKYVESMKSVLDQLTQLDQPRSIGTFDTGTLSKPLKPTLIGNQKGTTTAGAPIFTDGGIPFDASSLLAPMGIHRPVEIKR